MKQNFDTRLRKGLFPKTPQSFTDKLTLAAQKTAGAQPVQPETDAQEPQRSAHRFPVGKILAGAAAAVLAAASIVIAVFAPGIGRNKHGAVDPVAYNPLRGRWTLTEVEQNGETVDPETIGLQMQLQFSDESVTVSTQTGSAEGQYVYRYAFADNAVELTAESGEIPVLPASGVYDPEMNTLRFANEDGDGAVIFSRVLNKQTLTGIWKQTRREHAVDPSPLDGFDYDYLKWEKEQTWEEDAKPQPWYLEFTADGRMYYFLYAPDGGVQGNQSSTYTISGNTLTWSGFVLRYDAETDTICWIFPSQRREIYERASETEIVDPYRQKLSELRKQYPEYFGIDTFQKNLLKVYVWQINPASYSCALISGTDERSEIEIGMMKGVTIEEMRLILSTYYEARDCNIEPEQVEVVPFHNPISSYWYEIDEAYTGRVRWLLTGIPFECDDPLYSAPLDSKVDIGGILNLEVSTVCDVDGDGRLETCMLTYGPTSGLFTFTLSVYRNGTAVYRNTFQTAYGYFRFQRMTDGLNLYYYDADSIKTTGRSTAAYAVTIENGAIVLTDEQTGETVEYWGELDPQWNRYTKKAVERRFDGAWYSFSKGLLSDPAYDQLLLISFDADGEHVSFTEDRTRYEGYTYRVEPGDKPAIVLTDEKTGDVRRAVLDGTKLTFESSPHVNGERSAFEYKSVPSYEAADLPYAEPVFSLSTYYMAPSVSAEITPATDGTSSKWYSIPFCMFDLDGDGEKELIKLEWDEKSREMAIGAVKDSGTLPQAIILPNPRIEALVYTVEDVTDPGNLILIDLDPNDGHGNLLLSTTRTDGTEKTYELHVENGELVCGHTVEGYFFLNDSEQQELMLGAPTDLLGAKYGYREVKGEALEPADEWLQASALIERVMFGKREDNIKDGMLLHLVRALPCEIDGKPATLEPDVYMHLQEWHESMDRIVFLTEDDRRITVYLDGTAPYTVGGVPLVDYFDNAPQG
jgi:hypothetical protein